MSTPTLFESAPAGSRSPGMGAVGSRSGSHAVSPSTVRRRVSLAALVVVNLAVAAAALLVERGYQLLLFVYWVETLLIGILNVPRLLIGAVFARPVDSLARLREALSRLALALLALVFCAAVFVPLAMLMYVGIVTLPLALPEGDAGAGQLLAQGHRGVTEVTWWLISFLVASHAFSFVSDFLLGREFRSAGLIRLAVEPFLRVIVIVLVALAAVVMAHLQPLIAASAAFTVALMAIKLTGDILAHLHLHRRSR